MRYDARSAGALYLQNEIKLYQRILPGKLIAVWPLLDKSGAVSRDLSGAGRNGAYVNSPALGRDGILRKAGAPLFLAASTQYVSFTGAPFTSLQGAFNPLEGTLAIWSKVNSVADWTDGVNHRIALFGADASNFVRIFKSSSNGLTAAYVAGGTTSSVGNAAFSLTTWFHTAITWSKSSGASGEVKMYQDGIQFGTTQTGLGTWSGSLASARCFLGAEAGPAATWNGYLVFAALWSAAMPAALVPYIARRRPHALAA